MKMAWKLENIRKDPNSKELYADLFISQIKEEPKTACLFTIGDARTVEIILEKYKNTQFVVFDYPALIKFLDFAKPANLFNAIPIKYDWESEAEFLKFIEVEMQKILKEIEEANMSFDLIIANPPYGKSSSLSKKIVNKMLESKVAKEMVVLATPKTFYDNLNHVLGRAEVVQGGDYFEGLECSDIRVCTCLLSLSRTGPYKSLADFLLTEKQYRYYKAVADYRKGREDFFTSPGWITIKLKPFLDSHKKEIQEKGILFGVWSPYVFANGIIRFGEDWKYNKGLEDITLHNSSSAPWLLMLKGSKEKRNFLDWLYRDVTEDNKNIQGSLRHFAFNVLVSLYGGGVSPLKYLEILPSLDWSHPWTDQEILKELGLPEDFLEE